MRTLHMVIFVTAVVAIGAMTVEPCFGAPLQVSDITLVGDGSDKGPYVGMARKRKGCHRVPGTSSAERALHALVRPFAAGFALGQHDPYLTPAVLHENLGRSPRDLHPVQQERLDLAGLIPARFRPVSNR